MAALPLASIGYGVKLREANLGNGDRKKERECAEVSCRHNESAKREKERESEKEREKERERERERGEKSFCKSTHARTLGSHLDCSCRWRRGSRELEFYVRNLRVEKERKREKEKSARPGLFSLVVKVIFHVSIALPSSNVLMFLYITKSNQPIQSHFVDCNIFFSSACTGCSLSLSF